MCSPPLLKGIKWSRRTQLTGDPREALEKRLLAKLNALTVADGLPSVFRLVTRELIHLNDIKSGQLPACLLQLEEPEVTPKLSYVMETSLPGRIVLCFAPTTALPATTANAYRVVIERMLMNDVHLGGLIDAIWPTGTLMPGLWPEVGVLATGVTFRCLYEHHALSAAVTV